MLYNKFKNSFTACPITRVTMRSCYMLVLTKSAQYLQSAGSEKVQH